MSDINISENWTIIPGWAIEDYDLKGTELIIYSVIYGFSQKTNEGNLGCFSGSAKYLAKWAGCSRRRTLDILKSLTEKGLLEKSCTIEDGVKYVIYRALRPEKKGHTPYEETSHPPMKKFHTPYEETSPNNIANNINKNIDESIDIYSEYLNYWNTQVAGGAVPKIRSLTKTRNTHLKNLLKTYSKDDIIEVFTKVRQSKFLSGRNGKWRATFDWTIKPSNFIKVLEGNFDDDTGGPSEMIDGLAAYMEGN